MRDPIISCQGFAVWDILVQWKGFRWSSFEVGDFDQINIVSTPLGNLVNLVPDNTLKYDPTNFYVKQMWQISDSLLMWKWLWFITLTHSLNHYNLSCFLVQGCRRFWSWQLVFLLSQGIGHQKGYEQFDKVLMGLLRRILDTNKRVQEAACSAFATLEEVFAINDVQFFLHVV